MTDQDYHDAKKACQALAMALGTTGDEQNKLVQALDDIEKFDGENKRMIAGMLGMFLTGLLYGNWPWSPTKVDDILTILRDK